MDKAISFGYGIRRQPSIGVEGELSELVNLVPKNGELVNVKPMVEVGKITENHTLLCVHEVNGLKITKSGNTVYLGDKTITIGEFKTISTVGNVVVVYDEDTAHYAMWNGTEYVLFNDSDFAFNLMIESFDCSIKTAEISSKDIGDDELFTAIDTKINETIADDTQLFKYSTFGFAVLRFYDDSIASSTDMFTLDNVVEKTGMSYKDGKATYGLSKYKAVITHSIPKPIRSLVRSVDIYLSNSRHLCYHIKENTNGAFPVMTNSDMSKELANMQFYLSKSIDIADLGDDKTIHKLNRLAGGERVLEYNSSSISVSPSISFTYNSSLNVANIEYKHSNNKSKRVQSVYIGTPDSYDKKVYGYYGQIPDTSIDGTVNDLDGFRAINCCIEVEVVEDNVTDVIRLVNRKISYPIPPVFSFPNRNARKATIYINRSVDNVNMAGDKKYLKRTIELTPSSVGNFAFYIEKDMRYIQAYTLTGDTKIPTSELIYNLNEGWVGLMSYDFSNVASLGDSFTLSRNGKNIVKRSNTNNPFVFDDINTVSVGSGEIKGLSTSAKALSQGQFGQFPLYAFCSDGIWALEVSSDGSYSARQPISRDACNNSDSITQIDGAVVFTTGQGLKMVQGSDVVLLSSNMEGHNIDESVYFKPKADGTKFFAGVNKDYSTFDNLVVQETRDFREILKDCRIAYDYPNALLRIFPKKDYNGRYYVYSFDTREFAKVVETDKTEISSVVAGYPTTLVQRGKKILTFKNVVDDEARDGLLLTRPIDMGEPFAMKKLHDMRTLYTKHSDSTFVKVVIFVSNDGVHWAVLPSLRRGSFKYYRLGMITRMTDADRLSGTVMRYTVERNNKLR